MTATTTTAPAATLAEAIKAGAAGTVFTFTKDLTFINTRWASRKAGAHFVLGTLSESGYTFSAYNTLTGRWDDMMAESWIFEATRVIGVLSPASGCTCTCEGCEDCEDCEG
jgi:hypothetical protein